MNELQYIKSKFLASSHVLDFTVSPYEDDDILEGYNDFKKTLRNTNLLIEKADSIDSVMKHIGEARDAFHIHWKKMGGFAINPSYQKMNKLYFSANLNLPEE